jgi:glutamyl-tRNA reductase
MLTKRIINKLLHPTMVSLKEPVSDSTILATRLQVLRELFDLDAEERRQHPEQTHS